MRGTGRAAIDHDFRAGHVRRVIGREVEDRLGDFVGFAEPAEPRGASLLEGPGLDALRNPDRSTRDGYPGDDQAASDTCGPIP